MRRLKHLLVAAVLVLSLGALAFGADTASVSGTVYAQNGVTPMPKVKVTLSNSLISFNRDVVTNDDGEYQINGVPAASGYTITAFRDDGTTLATNGGIVVEVGDDKIIVPALREKPVAPVAVANNGKTPPETTPAAAKGPRDPVITNDTRSTSISAVVNREQLKTLPLFNRNFLALGLLAPNTHDVEAGSPLAGATFSISGSKPSSNNFLLDGADNVASSSNQAIPFQVNEAIQEFRVTTSTATAEFGRGQGGVVNVVTQRGTSKVRGSAFGYVSTDALNQSLPISAYANSGFAKATAYAGSPNSAAATTLSRNFSFLDPVTGSNVNTGFSVLSAGTFNQLQKTVCAGGSTSPICGSTFNPAAILSQNDSRVDPYNSRQFGFNLGGPLRKDKVFLFGSYEGTIIDNPNPIFERVPTALDRSVSPAIAAAGAANGAASAAMAQKILGLFPKANVMGVPNVLEFYRGEAPNFTNVHNVLLRSDYAKSENTSYNVRYVGQLLNSLHDDTLPEQNSYKGNGAYRNAQNQGITLSQSHTFHKNWINDLRLSFTQFRVDDTAQDNVDGSTLGLPIGPLPSFLLSGIDPRTAGASSTTVGGFAGWVDSFWGPNTKPGGSGGAPATLTTAIPSLDGLFPFARIGAPLSAPSRRRDTTSLGADSLSFGYGKHQFKIGAEHRYLQNVFSDGGLSRGYVVSNNIGEFTNDSETCISCGEAFRLPSYDYAVHQQAPYVGDFRSYAVSGFFQDSWRLRPTLTINAGLRYEFNSQPKEDNNRIFNFDPSADGLVQQGSTAVLDPYLNQCGVTSPRLDLTVRAAGGGIQPWNCKTRGDSGLAQLATSNFGPRLGISWAPRGGKTVLRGGAGLFYDQLPTSYTAQLLQNRPSATNFNSPSILFGQNFHYGQFNTNCVSQCGFGNASLSLAPGTIDPFRQSAAASPALYQLNTGGKSPSTLQINGSVQQQLGPNFTMEAGYVGNIGYNQPVLTNSGFLNEWYCVNTAACDNLSYFPVFSIRNSGDSDYHSGMLRLRGAQFHGLRVNASYSYSRGQDNTSSGLFPQLSNTLFSQLVGAQLYAIGNPLAAAVSLPSGSGPLVGPNGQIVVQLPNCKAPSAVAVCNSNPAILNQASIILGNLRQLIAGVVRVPFVDTSSTALTTTGARGITTTRYLIPQDPLNFRNNDWSDSDYNTTQRFVVDYNYEVPFMHNSNAFGGWSVSGIMTLQSGQPYTIFAGPAFGEVNQRVNAIGTFATNDGSTQALTASGTPNNLLPALAPSCTGIYASTPPQLFGAVPGSACTGSTRRNQFTGPRYFNVDLGVQKQFHVIDEQKRVFLRAEFYNLFNRDNFYNPISAYSLDGVSQNPDFGSIKSSHNPQQIQLALRFEF